MKNYCLISSVALLVGLFSGAIASPAPRKPPIRNWTTIPGWKTASWKGNDKPYQQIRNTIDNAIKGGQKPQELIEFYELPALEHSNDPQLQFKWAYAAYIATIGTDYNTGENILGHPRKALVLAPFPNSFEYARLIFLTVSYMGMTYGLQDVSKRMVQHSPFDYDVKYAAADNLVFSARPSDRQLGLKYINDLFRDEPLRASPHSLLGSYYYSRWLRGKKKEDGDHAIANYQRYLELSSIKESFRQRAEEIIKEIQQG